MNHAVDLQSGKLSPGGMDVGQMFGKLTAALMATVTTMIGPIPDDLRHWGVFLIALFALDTLAGFYVAVVFREVWSRKFIEGIANKGVLFCIVITVGFAGSMFTKTWGICYLSFGSACLCEVISLLEKGKRLQGKTDVATSGLMNVVLGKLESVFKTLAVPNTTKVPVVPVVNLPIDPQTIVNEVIQHAVKESQGDNKSQPGGIEGAQPEH